MVDKNCDGSGHGGARCDPQADSTQRQHYINRSLMKRWSEKKRVGVVCTLHRSSAVMAIDDLHCVRSLWSSEQEHERNDEESRSAQALNGLIKKLRPGRRDLRAAREFLAEPQNLRHLIDFVVLHRARSLEPVLQQLIDNDGVPDCAEIEAAIKARREQAQDYYDCGIELSVLPAGCSVVLGVAPVFDVRDWGGPEPGDALFMMPLTPWLVIAGTLDRSSGQASVGESSASADALLDWQIAGFKGLTSAPYLICAPSALEQIAEDVLQRTEGGMLHWSALSSRIDLCGTSVDSRLRRDWDERITRCRQNLGWLQDPTTTESRKSKIKHAMAADARKIQNDLDDLGVPICDCDRLRQHEKTQATWESVMPPKLCCQSATPLPAAESSVACRSVCPPTPPPD